MSKFKKALALAIMMVFLLQAGISFAKPSDVEGHWAQEQIMEWLDKGWTQYGDDGKFYPDAKITRGEFIALTNKAFGFEKTTQVNFPDLHEDHMYAEDVAKAVAAGYISGFDDGTVRPDEQISRVEVTVILVKIIAELPLPQDESVLTKFSDYEDIPDWARTFVAVAVHNELLSGYPDGSFRPQGNITRAEAITVLNNAKSIFSFLSEKITKPGNLEIKPGIVDSGSSGRIVLFYSLGDDFTKGSVIFQLPAGIKAVAGRDWVAISGTGRDTEIIWLDPDNIQNEGREVRVTDVTAAEGSVVMLLLEGITMPEPGFHAFKVIADADGSGEKLPTENDQYGPTELFSYYETTELFSRIPLGYEGSLELSPQSAKSGSKQTISLTYTFGNDFNEGCVEFSLPEEISFTAGQDKVIINGVEKILAEEDIGDNGQKVHIKGITAQKGDRLTMTIYDKLIPEAGAYFFAVKADVDGEEGSKPATLGSGREFMAFLSYTEVTDNYNIVESFFRAINEGDAEAAIALLADDVVFVDNYLDGFLYMDDGKENVEEIIKSFIKYESRMKYDDSNIRKLSENIWQVEGIVNDYSDIIIAEMYPDEGYEGFRYTSKFFVTDNKICYIEFQFNLEDELLWDKLTGGPIGFSTYLNDSDEVEVIACVPGMPADKAGILPGDIIVAVDGIDVQDMKFALEEVAIRVSGKAGTKVKLTINRDGQVFDIEVERAASW